MMTTNANRDWKDQQWSECHRWRGKLERDHQACVGPFKELIEARRKGVDPVDFEIDLVNFLINLENSVVGSSGRTSMNERELTEFAKKLKGWAREIQVFDRSTTAGIVKHGVPMWNQEHKRVDVVSVNLPTHLEQLATEVARVAATAGKVRNPWQSRALMLLDDYIRRATGKPRYEALDLLAAAVLGKTDFSVREPAARFRKIWTRT